MKPAEVRGAIAALALLDEPVRRALYFFVAGQPAEVSRDQAARAVRISRTLAAFHLDKLAEAGLLDVAFRRLGARRGPGAGRPSKLYRQSARELDVSLPPRRYQLMARVFARSIESAGASAREALSTTAHTFGRDLGAEARRRAGPGVGRGRLLSLAERVLDEFGFHPYREKGLLRLRNCPFDALAADHRDLVCGANLSLMQGFLTGLSLHGIRARLEPEAGRCCVALRLAPGRSG